MGLTINYKNMFHSCFSINLITLLNINAVLGENELRVLRYSYLFNIFGCFSCHFDMSFIMTQHFVPFKFWVLVPFNPIRVATGPGKSWKVLEFKNCPGKSLKVLEFFYFLKKSWKSPGISESFFYQFFFSAFPDLYDRIIGNI